MGTRLSETELQKSLDFCVNLFSPTTPEQHARVAKGAQISQELLDVTAPVMGPHVLEGVLRVERKEQNVQSAGSSAADGDSSDEASSDCEKQAETEMVLNKINARRVVHSEYSINNLESEPVNGYVVRLERGRLGLAKV